MRICEAVLNGLSFRGTHPARNANTLTRPTPELRQALDVGRRADCTHDIEALVADHA